MMGMNKKRIAKIGDIVKAKGMELVIAEIYSQESYREINGQSLRIDFKCSNGIYRSYRSEEDCGTVVTKDGKEV